MSDRWNPIDMLKVGDSNISYGVKIIFKDGAILPDYIDPLTDDRVDESETKYYLDNGYAIYAYKKDEVKELVRVEICQSGVDLEG